ncbi:MAG: DUF1761 domain-containing protein [Nocardioidaceae bacterium]
MPDVNVWAVLVAGVASFVASGVWYAVFGDSMAALQAQWRGATPPDGPEPWKLLGFFGSGLVVALAVAVLVDLGDVGGWLDSLGLGVLLWVGFCATQWVGSVLGEQVPVRLAAIHAGDWLAHLLIIAVIVGVLR